MPKSRLSIAAISLAVLMTLLAGFLLLEVQSLTSEWEAARQRVEILVAENQSLDRRARNLAEQNGVLRERLATFNRQQAGLDDVAADLRMELNEVTVRHERLVETQKATLERLETAQERIAQLRAVDEDNAELRRTLEGLTTQLNFCQATHEELSIETDELSEQVAQCEAVLRERREPESTDADGADGTADTVEPGREWQPPR